MIKFCLHYLKKLKLIVLLQFVLLCALNLAFGNEIQDLDDFDSGRYFSDDFVASKLAGRILENYSEDDPITRFYLTRSFEPFWYGNLSNTDQLYKAIKQTSNHGLPESRYDFTLKMNELDIYDFEVKAMESFINLI